MIINIDDNYRIRVESHSNNTLEKLIRDESGAVKLGKDNLPLRKVFGYYPSVKWALRGYAKLDIMDRVDETTVKGYLHELQVENEKIDSLLGKVDR